MSGWRNTNGTKSSTPLLNGCRSNYKQAQNPQTGDIVNWLAHIYFSEPSTEYQLGNLLADILRPEDRNGFGPAFDRGVECHFAIDRFTDTHESVIRSRALLHPNYHHYPRVMVDIYYAHSCAVNWTRYCDCPYRTYVQQFHDAVKNTPLVFPPYAGERLDQIISENWLGEYDRISSVARAFARMSLRTRRPEGAKIAHAADDLQRHYDSFHHDFEEFYPDLCRFIHHWRNRSDSGT